MKAVLLALAIFVVVACGSRLNGVSRVSRLSRRAINVDETVTCGTYYCVGKGKTCGETVDYNGNTLTETDCNNINLGCQITGAPTSLNFTGTCVTLPTAGQACLTITDDCGEFLECKSGTCQAETYDLDPGQSCSGTSDVCHFMNSTLSDVNVCTGGVCQFIADGANCTSTEYQCKYTSYCNITSYLPYGGTCVALSADGQPCDLVKDDNCLNDCHPSSTTSTAGTCGSDYSVAAGSPCESIDDCIFGLYCAAPASGASFGVCTTPAASTTLHKACSTQADCATDGTEICECNSKYSKGPVCLSAVYNKNAQGDYTSYINCITKNNCEETDDECLIAHCKNQACSLDKNEAPDLYDPAQQCGSPCGSASSVVVSYFVLAALAAFLMF